MKKQGMLLMFAFVIVTNGTVLSQGRVSDYLRADSLQEWFSNKVYYGNVRPVWTENGQSFTYSNLTDSGTEYILVNIPEGKKSKAFNHSKLAQALSKEKGNSIDKGKLPVNNIRFSNDLKSFSFTWDNYTWTCQLPSYRLSRGEKTGNNRRRNRGWAWGQRDETANDPVISPDGKLTAFIRDYNLWVKDDSDNEFQLSHDGGIGEYYSSYVSWSPDSKKLMAYRVRPVEKHLINYIESSPDNKLQPVLHTYEYLKPGDAIPQKYPQIFDVHNKKHIHVDENFIPNQYDIGFFRWSDDSRLLSFEYNKRGHQLYQVIEIDGMTGIHRILINEESETFFDYSGKKYRYDLKDGNAIIWASERDGWNHLYISDRKNDGHLKQITKGQWVVRGVEWVDENERKIIFSASGKEEGDPYFINYYSIDFDGKNLRRLSKGSGNHTASFSPDKKYFIDTWSTVDTPPESVLRETWSGNEIMSLEKADLSALRATGWIAPENFVSKGRDGTTDIWGVIFRPTNFDPNKKYPVIEYIYAGPHSSFVPKSFRPYYGHIQPLAELGFIVVQIDGMGTSNRSKAFHDICYKNLKDAGFPDRILWMKAAAEKYAFMDISKTGIYGTSAGGQNSTGGLLFHPDFYKVGVSSCGCHDNRMDKIWWNEQWMGWPVGKEYIESSNVENAYRLEGKLLLINGEMDFNVDPSSTTQLVNALIKANKNFDYLLVPGMGHSSGGRYGELKRRDFFVKHLLGIDPPEWLEYNR